MKTMQRMAAFFLMIMILVSGLGDIVTPGMAEAVQQAGQEQQMEMVSPETAGESSADEPEPTVNLYSVAGAPARALSNALKAANADSVSDPADPANGEVDLGNEADGSKIEKIDIFWVSPDRPQNDGIDSHLYLSTSSNALLNMQFQIEVSFSGEFDYLPGDITIRFPAQIWHKRGSEALYGNMSYSVPEAPSTAADFN